jgi:Lon protease-like protein
LLTVEVSYLAEEPPEDSGAIEALVREIRAVFRDYLRLLVEFSGMHADIELPEDPVDASFLIGDALQVADSMKQRLLELSSTEQRLTVELGFLRRLLPQLRSLLERKRESPQEQPTAAPGGTFRANQEKYFGKHFSLN